MVSPVQYDGRPYDRFHPFKVGEAHETSGFSFTFTPQHLQSQQEIGCRSLAFDNIIDQKPLTIGYSFEFNCISIHIMLRIHPRKWARPAFLF
jgi:hypothetical protein